jgi:menaquinone-dependent protoporphyrinogen oxidase
MSSDVLVVYATVMGATREIAEEIAEVVRPHGVTVDVCDARDRPDPTGYRGVVLGSALYLRRWRPEAMRFLRAHVPVLRDSAVWLFQSGPTRRTDVSRVPWTVRRLAGRVGAMGPTTFGGRLDRDHATGVVTRWVASSPELCGDARDWDAIRAWADDIGVALRTGPRAGHERGTDSATTDSAPPPAR